MIILKPQGFETSLTTNTAVSNSTLVRVINTGNTATLTFANAGVSYANLTVTNTQFVIVQKGSTDTLQGTGMIGAPVAWKN
jgi:hypothetical protein